MAKKKAKKTIWVSDRAKWDATYRKTHPLKTKESNQKWFASAKGKATRKKYLSNPKVRKISQASKRAWEKRNKKLSKEIRKRWIENNREKRKAHQLVQTAIRNGRLKRKPCMKCGKKADAHHSDYSKPLVVKWLCPKHHKEVHRK